MDKQRLARLRQIGEGDCIKVPSYFVRELVIHVDELRDLNTRLLDAARAVLENALADDYGGYGVEAVVIQALETVIAEADEAGRE